jgi:hypothetical protein
VRFDQSVAALGGVFRLMQHAKNWGLAAEKISSNLVCSVNQNLD